jgi:ATP-binding cassette subfamily B protein
MSVEITRPNLPADGRKRRKRKQKKTFQTFKRIILTYHPYRGQLAVVLLAILATTILNLAVPLMIPLVYDDALIHHQIDHLILYILIMVIATSLSGLIGVGQSYLTNRVGQYVMRDFRNKLYAHLQDMSLRFFTSMPTGEMQSRLSNDVNGAQSTVTDTFTNTITSLVTVSSTVAAMLYLSPLLTLVSFAFLPVFLFLSYKMGNVRRAATRETQQSLAALTVWMQETLSINGILLIKAFGRKRFVQKQFETENQKFAELSIRQQMVGRWFLMWMNDFFTLAPVILALVAGVVIIYIPNSGNLTIGKLIAFVTLQESFLDPCARLIASLINLQGSLALFDRLFEYLDLPIEIQDAPDALHLSLEHVRGEVTFKNVSFSYNKSLTRQIQLASPKRLSKLHKNRLVQMSLDSLSRIPRISLDGISRISLDGISRKVAPQMTLSDLSFTIKPGQLVAIVGPSGSGKTTITYLILRLYDIQHGVIEIDGYDVKKIAMQTLSDLIGIVTQETYLFHASIRDNLLYICPEATEKDMVAAAKSAGIHDRILQLDHGYDTVVGERGYKLSGGEKQRLAIARVLLKNPKILILDEATSALDTRSEYFIQEALKPLMKGRTTLAIAHRLSTILAADLILVLDKGKIVEQGTHQELLNRKGVYAQLYQQQFAHQTQENYT